MTRELLEGILSKITELANSNIYDITLTPINEEQIQLDMNNQAYLESRKIQGFHRIRKVINIHEPIKLKLQ